MKYEPESENGGFIKEQMKFKWDVFLILSLRRMDSDTCPNLKKEKEKQTSERCFNSAAVVERTVSFM